MSEVVLIDLSSIAHPIWHQSQSEPDPNHTSQQIVARVRALATGQPHVAICCDSGRSFRHDITATYKANRPEHDEPLRHQITLACEQLAGDGFPIWSVKGFEADDLIASACQQALGVPETTVLIVTADKDLLQLVGPRVRAMSVRDGGIADEAVVKTKFGVTPDQIRDFLTLVGDTSDNIKGAAGIGPKKAAELLQRYGSLDATYQELAAHPTAFRPGIATALKEFLGRVDETRALVTLRTDVELPFHEIATERVIKDVEPMPTMEDDMELPQPTVEPVVSPDGRHGVEAAKGEVTDLPGNGAPKPDASSASRLNQQLAVVPDAEVLPPATYERQLDPRSLREAGCSPATCTPRGCSQPTAPRRACSPR
jgi:5'-3' exonuclease